PDLCGGLVVRASQRRVDALAQRGVKPAGKAAKAARVDLGEVDEPRRVVLRWRGPRERRSIGEVEVVRERDRGPWGPLRIEAARRVGQDDGAAPREHGRAHAVDDVWLRASLIEVDPPDEHDHTAPLDLEGADRAGVPGDGRGRSEEHTSEL